MIVLVVYKLAVKIIRVLHIFIHALQNLFVYLRLAVLGNKIGDLFVGGHSSLFEKLKDLFRDAFEAKHFLLTRLYDVSLFIVR